MSGVKSLPVLFFSSEKNDFSEGVFPASCDSVAEAQAHVSTLGCPGVPCRLSHGLALPYKTRAQNGGGGLTANGRDVPSIW